MSYEQDMYIDENMLDVELLGQASLMSKYSRMLAEAIRDRDIAKESVELMKAEINLDIRKDPLKYKLEKVTDNSVAAAILMEQDFQDAQNEYNEANYQYNVMLGVVKATEHRKSALENLVKLNGQNYFAGPALPHDMSTIRAEHDEKLSHRIGGSLKRTTPKQEQ